MRADQEPETEVADAWKSPLTKPAIATAVCDLQCTVRYANRAFEDLIGVEPGRAEGALLPRIAVPEALEGILHHLRRACSGDATAFVFHGLSPKSAELFSISLLALPLNRSGQLDGIVCIGFPTAVPAFATPSEGPFITALDKLVEGAAIIDDDCRLKWANKAFTRITGFEGPAQPGGRLPFLSSDGPLLHRARGALDREGFWQGEVQAVDAQGAPLCLLASVSSAPYLADDVPRWLVLFSDISRQYAYTTHLEALIEKDALTGLLGRDGFGRRITNALYRCHAARQYMAVLFLDLDGFKSINDTVGHEAGDCVLQQVAERLRATAANDSAAPDVARLGGDEFAMLISPRAADSAGTADRLCRSILASFDEPILALGQSFRLAASVGGALGPLPDETAGELLHRADQAMYRVKRQDGNGFFIDPIQ